MERRGAYMICDVCGAPCRGSLGYRRHLYTHIRKGGEGMAEKKRKERLNGRWVSNADESVSVWVDKVYKRGDVKGFTYKRLEEGGEVIGEFRATHEELQRDYTKKM